MSTVILPQLSRIVAANDWSGAKRTIKSYTSLILLTTIPATLILILFSHSLTAFVFQRGAFTAGDTAQVASVQSMYLLQLPFYVLGRVFVRRYFRAESQSHFDVGNCHKLPAEHNSGLLVDEAIRSFRHRTINYHCLCGLALLHLCDVIAIAEEGRKMRLTLVISSLACGGAERVMTTVANYWAARGRDITLLTLDDGSVPPFYELDDRVCHKALGLAGNSCNRATGLRNNFKRISGLRRELSAIASRML